MRSLQRSVISLIVAVAACAPASVATHPVVETFAGDVAPVISRKPVPASSLFVRIAPAELSARPAAALVRPAASESGSRAATDETVWQGTYEGGTYGRRGALAILLRPATSGIRGTIAWRVQRTAAGTLDAAAAGAERVTLVRAPIVSGSRAGDQVTLEVDRYFDPGCNCTAQATFRGLVRGDTLVGRFHVAGAATVVGEDRGRFRAVRLTP